MTLRPAAGPWHSRRPSTSPADSNRRRNGATKAASKLSARPSRAGKRLMATWPPVLSVRPSDPETSLILLVTRARSAAAVFIGAILLVFFSFLDGSARAQEGDGATAQEGPGEPQVSLEYFRERLEPFGAWFEHPVWGAVWQPDAAPGFRPYFDGHWEYTSDAGSLWVSNEPYGDIVYHYGRWVFDRDDGWLWVPGYVWAPSWVLWRANQDYVGWLPMPPGYLDYYGLFTSPYLADNWYGYRTFYGPIYGPTFVSEHYFTLWVFVHNKDFGDGDGHRRHHVKDIRQLRDLYHRTVDRTRYAVDRDRIVDRYTDRNWWQARAGGTIEGRTARERMRRDDAPMTLVSEGRTLSRRYGLDDRDPRVARPRPPAPDRRADESVAGQVPETGLASPARSIDRAPRERGNVAGTASDERAVRPRSTRIGAAPPVGGSSADDSSALQVPAARGLATLPRAVDRVARGRSGSATLGPGS